MSGFDHQQEKGESRTGEWQIGRSAQKASAVRGRMKTERTVIIRVEKCRRPGCNNPVHSRGLYRSDYQQAWRYVATGATTWEELETTGRVAECQHSFKHWLLGSKN